jgi:hypothetical protein
LVVAESDTMGGTPAAEGGPEEEEKSEG